MVRKGEIINKEKILQCLTDNNGMLVQDIAKGTGLSRNTVYRYLGILESEDLIFKRNFGLYNLYFSKESRQISRDIVSSYYKGLLVALNEEIPLNPIRFKVFGKKIANYVNLPNEAEDFHNLINLKPPIKKNTLKLLDSMRPYFSLLHDKITLKSLQMTEDKKKIIFHFVNSDLLEEDIAYIFHFYILTGFIEAKIKKHLNIIVECEVLDYKVAKEDNQNFVKISLEFR